MNIYASFGALVGIIIGLILCVILFKFANRNHKVKSEYDERQKELRGRAYQYAFYTIAGYEAMMIILAIGGISIPAADYLVHFTGIILGCIVLSGYCIWKDVYWGINNNKKRYIAVFAVCMLINSLPVINMIREGSYMQNGKLGAPYVNVLAILMMVVVCIELLIKSVLDNKREDADE